MKQSTASSNPCRFSKKQLEVMRAWSECPDPSVIARQLHISEHTVQTHLKRIRRKAGVHRTVEAWMRMTT
jgi:DNA-binding NarL/FixJ family response regulator